MKIRLTALFCILFTFQLSYGQVKPEDLKVDTTITGFHFAANFQGTMVWTVNGPSDLKTENPTAFSFTVAQNTTYEALVAQIKQYLGWSIQNGYTHTGLVEKDTTVNGNRAYYTTTTETQKGTNYKNMVFHGFIIKDNTGILFISGDLDNGKYIEGFRKTFFAVKF